jgi:hypothetical protein
MRVPPIVLVASVLVLAACSGGDDKVPHGSATLSGAASFAVFSGYENAPVDINGNTDLSKVKMVLLDRDWSCGDLQTKSEVPHQFLELALHGPQAFTAGTYSVQPIGQTYAGTPLVEIGTFTDGLTTFGATGGTLTLDVISTTEMKGSFSVTDDGGASLSGTFDTHFCFVPEAFQ